MDTPPPATEAPVSAGTAAAWAADRTVPVAAYSAALDEIYRLRSALAYEALALATTLEYKSLPKSRRRVMEEQVERMQASARGEAEIAYAGRSSQACKYALRAAGAKETLTRAAFEAERPGRGHRP